MGNRAPRPAPEKILVLDRGNVELAFPAAWSVKPDPKGFLKLEDRAEECLLEVSYMRLPRHAPGAPTVAERVRLVLDAEPPSRGAEVRALDRADLDAAWGDYPYACPDPRRGGEPRGARGRCLIAANGLFQVLMTFSYWADDAGWAVPAWERIVETLQLGHGAQLASPQEHWSLRESS